MLNKYVTESEAKEEALVPRYVCSLFGRKDLSFLLGSSTEVFEEEITSRLSSHQARGGEFWMTSVAKMSLVSLVASPPSAVVCY